MNLLIDRQINTDRKLFCRFLSYINDQTDTKIHPTQKGISSRPRFLVVSSNKSIIWLKYILFWTIWWHADRNSNCYEWNKKNSPFVTKEV